MRCAPVINAARLFPMIDLMKLPAGKLLVGCSGGADSAALLRMLHAAQADVTAVHVNHGLRGAESDGDEAFVRELCRRLNIPLLVYQADPPPNPGEDWARKARYGFFRRAMAETGAAALVLAHHRDDQAETMMLHLLRGAGLNGLTGMAADAVVDGVRMIRPLLGYSRAELRAYLTEKGQIWREDGSNAENRYLRNALRHELLPVMEQLAPGASQRIAAAAGLLREDEQTLQTLTAEFLAAHPGDALPLDDLRKQPAGLQKRILRAWWTAVAEPREERSLSLEQTNALHALVQADASAKCNLPGGWHGRTGWSHIHLISPCGTQALPETPAMGSPLLAAEEFSGHPGGGKTCQAFPKEWLAECTVRSRRAGDFIRPFGSEGRKSLQDYLMDRKIDAPFRDRIPLLCRGSEVLLAGGVGAGNIPRSEDIENPVLLRWTQSFPWQPK